METYPTMLTLRQIVCAVTANVGIVVSVAGVTAWTHVIAPPPAAVEDGIAVYFSPRSGCTEATIYEIGQAQHTIDVMAYSFTAAQIEESLLRAA